MYCTLWHWLCRRNRKVRGLFSVNTTTVPSIEGKFTLSTEGAQRSAVEGPDRVRVDVGDRCVIKGKDARSAREDGDDVISVGITGSTERDREREGNLVN